MKSIKSVKEDLKRPPPEPVAALEAQTIGTIRQKQEEAYMKKAQTGRRMRKNGEQMQVLLAEFEKSPKWSYEHAVQIGQRIGMTFHQVSKWNWDQRKLRGISTERKKKSSA